MKVEYIRLNKQRFRYKTKIDNVTALVLPCQSIKLCFIPIKEMDLMVEEYKDLRKGVPCYFSINKKIITLLPKPDNKYILEIIKGE